MIIPKKLKIGAHIFEVRETDDIEECGNADVASNLIRINSKMPPDQKEATLFHEILGAVNSTFHDKQHDLLDSLAEQLYQVFKENKIIK